MVLSCVQPCVFTAMCFLRNSYTARSDLLGSEGVVEFLAGDRLKNVILAPRNDDLPEVCAMRG